MTVKAISRAGLGRPVGLSLVGVLSIVSLRPAARRSKPSRWGSRASRCRRPKHDRKGRRKRLVRDLYEFVNMPYTPSRRRVVIRGR